MIKPELMYPKALIPSFLLVVSCVQLWGQTEPRIGTCNGNQTVCLTKETFELCASITVQPGLPAAIDHFEIDWGDGTTTRLDGSESPADQSHTYDLSSTFGSCQVSRKFTILLETFLTDGSPARNNAFVLTLTNPPKAQFSPRSSIVCAGGEASFRNDACPEDGLNWVWDYGDGTTGTENEHTYNQTGIYIITQTVWNECDTATTTRQIEVIDPAVAVGGPISGTINLEEPYSVCLNGGGTVDLDGTRSLHADTYLWSPRRGTGFSWLTQRDSSGAAVQFTRPGDYRFFLRVDNACEQPAMDTLDFRVVEGESLSLSPQTDACEFLEYSPSPYSDNASYELNGIVISTFPIYLDTGTYVVKASLSNECGLQERSDTFRVEPLAIVDILNQDLTICAGEAPFAIEFAPMANEEGGCVANGNQLASCQFDPALAEEEVTLITYEGTCILSDTLRVEVVKTDLLSVEIPKTTYCVDEDSFAIAVNRIGGLFTANGIEDPASNIYRPGLAGPGIDTITYWFSVPTSLGDTCLISESRILTITPTLSVGFQVQDCKDNEVTFDTVNISQGFDRIEWNFGDGNTSQAVKPVHNYRRAGSYVVSVLIEQQGGCIATFTETVVVEAAPLAAFELISDAELCSPRTVDIVDRSSGTNRSYLWDFGNGSTSTSPNPGVITYQAFGRDTFFVLSLTLTNGCSSDFFMDTVFVKAGPNPVFEIDKSLHCSGEFVAFHSIYANASASDHWEWDFGDGSPLFFGRTPPPHVFETSIQDTFMVSLRVGNMCDTLSYTVPAIVVPSDVQAFLNVDKTIGCDGGTFRFINASGVPNAEFFFSDGIHLSGDTVFHAFATPVDSLFSVRMRVFGCGYDDTTMVVRILPSPPIQVSYQEKVCSGEEVSFTIESTVAGTKLSYGDGDSTLQNISTHIYQNPGWHVIRAQATSSSQCTNEIVDSIFVMGSPVAGFVVEDDPVCAGNSITLRDTSIGNIMRRNWVFGDGNFGIEGTSTTHIYNKAGVYVVALAIEDQNSCVDTIQTALEVRPLPAPIINYALVDSCGPAVTLGLGDAVITSVVWTLGDGQISSLTNPDHVYPGSGKYKVSVIAELEGCRDSTSREIEIPSIPEFIITYDQLSSCAPSVTQFHTETSIGESVQWAFPDGSVSFEANNSYSFLSPGSYPVLISISNGQCTVDTTLFISVGMPLLAEAFNKSDVDCFGESTGSLSIGVTSGNMPYSFQWPDGAGNSSRVELAAGTYEVTVTDALRCETIVQETIGQPEAPLAVNILDLHPISCIGGSDGFVEVVATGGNGPYSYQWFDGNTDRWIDGLTAGTYLVSISDQSNCETTAAIELRDPTSIQADFEIDPPKCFGDKGNISIKSISGGWPASIEPAYQVSLSPGFEAVNFYYTDLQAGTYKFYIRDTRSCIDSMEVILSEPAEWNLSLAQDTIFISKGESVELRPDITNVSAMIAWSPNYNIDDVSNLTPIVTPFESTNYTIEANLGECRKEAMVHVVVNDTFSVYIPNSFTPRDDQSKSNGINDYFTAFCNYPAVRQISYFLIVNKQGQILFEKENIPIGVEEEGWDGYFQDEPMPQDKYTYRILVECVDGSERAYSGTVLLIR